MQKIISRRPPIACNLEDNELHPLLRHVYALRGISSKQDLERGLDHLLPYSCLLGIEQAVACLYQALVEQQTIVIIGDFDADGATSSALAVSALRSFGAKNITYLVPNRFEYGYGLTPEIVDVAAQRQPQLLITVDNGIASISGVTRANELGIKVVITDHHLPGAELPAAAAIVNPNQIGDSFPSKNLAGVGVIFYVMLALRSHLRSVDWFKKAGIPEPNMAQFLDLVAVGTVADVVPLDKNNRILVHQGMHRIRAGKVRAGIKALLEVAGRDYARICASDLAFIVAPRLNAAGRLDDMSFGIECLLCEDANQARNMAVRLDMLNKERQAIEADMHQQAHAVLRQLRFDQDIPLGLCLYDSSWHQGVVGIVASRIKDQLHRPVIAFALVGENELKGSARSIAGVHIRDVLEAIATRHPQLIDKFGGHAMAAGLSLRLQNYEAFTKAFAEEVAKHITLEDLQGRVHSDGELTPEYLCLQVAELLRDGGPWGQAFPEPIFDNCFEVVEQRLVGSKHLKMMLCIPESRQLIDAIAFNINPEHWPNHRVTKIRAAYRLDVNEFRGRKTVQLMIEHLEIISN